MIDGAGLAIILVRSALHAMHVSRSHLLIFSTLVQSSEEALFVYMCTPLGPALAQITEQHLLKGRAVSALLASLYLYLGLHRKHTAATQQDLHKAAGSCHFASHSAVRYEHTCKNAGEGRQLQCEGSATPARRGGAREPHHPQGLLPVPVAIGL